MGERKVDARVTPDNPRAYVSARAFGALSAIVFLSVSPLAAQAPRKFASPFLAADHWAVTALRKLDALGLLPAGYDPGLRSRARAEVADLLRQAVSQAEQAQPSIYALADGYAARFAEEFRAVSGPWERHLAWEGAADGGLERHEGAMWPGTGNEEDTWTGPVPGEEVAGAAGGGSVAVLVWPYLAAQLSAGRAAAEWRLDEAYLAARWRSLGFWFGERAPAYGPGVGGSIILGGAVSVTGGGFFLASPAELPSFLGLLGPLRLEAFLARLERNGSYRHPWLGSGRISIMPHARLSLAFTRGAMFGGENNEPVTLEKLLNLLVGNHVGAGVFENQLASIDVRYRPPLPWALAAYLEWGIEDSAGAFFDVPGLVTGLELGAVPGVPALGVSIERASFARSCCGNPIWYRHRSFTSGWAEDGVLLGHPLGGHGREWLVRASADLVRAGLLVDVRGFARERGDENMYAPDREGESTGVAGRLEWRATPRVELFLAGGHEWADKWDETRTFLGGRVLF